MFFKDFKVTGNHTGYSVTLCMMNSEAHMEDSPRSQSSLQSKHKTPAAYKRDHERRQLWSSSNSDTSPALCGSEKRIHNDGTNNDTHDNVDDDITKEISTMDNVEPDVRSSINIREESSTKPNTYKYVSSLAIHAHEVFRTDETLKKQFKAIILDTH